jgi:hypothetical protein
MSLGLAITMALGLAFSPALQTGTGELVRDACVETGMRRAELEALAETRGWRAAPVTSQSGRQLGWNLVYRAGDALVMTSHDPAFDASDPEVGSVCTVGVRQASTSLESEVSALAASLDLAEEAPIGNQPTGQMTVRTWSRLGDKTLTYAVAPNGQATISLSRQVVTTVSTPAPPPGN